MNTETETEICERLAAEQGHPERYAGDWPNDPINGNDPRWGLEQEGLALANLASAVHHIGEGGQVDARAVAHIGDAIERHARRVERFVAQLQAREHAEMKKRVEPMAENPLALRLLRDRLVTAAAEVSKALAPPAPGTEPVEGLSP